MSGRLSAAQIAALADHLGHVARGLTSYRRAAARTGSWWRPSPVDLQAAIAIAVGRCVLKTAGEPVHSVAAWQKDWEIGR